MLPQPLLDLAAPRAECMLGMLRHMLRHVCMQPWPESGENIRDSDSSAGAGTAEVMTGRDPHHVCICGPISFSAAVINKCNENHQPCIAHASPGNHAGTLLARECTRKIASRGFVQGSHLPTISEQSRPHFEASLRPA